MNKNKKLTTTKEDCVGKKLTVLQSLRKGKGLTQKQLAKKLGIPYGTYTNYELGYRKIPATILVKLERFFGVSASTILNDFSQDKNEEIDTYALYQTFSDVIVDMQTLERLINLNTNVFCETNYIFLDYGANIKGYTLVSQKPSRYQMLNFKELDLLKNNEFTLKMALILIDNIKKRGW